MVNYNNGKIYKIEPLNGEEGDIYIGSTTKEYLSQRMDKHRSDYKRFLKEKSYNVTSYNLFNKYGVSNCKIVLLELVNVNTKDELLQREAHYIKNLKCVNKMTPLRTHREYYEDNKDKIKETKKEYYEQNKEKRKEYYEQNKDKIKDKFKEYYQQIKETKKEYYQQNKDKLKEYREAKKKQQL